jgi:hypothetical protein
VGTGFLPEKHLERPTTVPAAVGLPNATIPRGRCVRDASENFDTSVIGELASH